MLLRVAIGGVPRSGKTTLAAALSLGFSLPIRETDDLIDLGWSPASAKAAEWFNEPGPWVIEGVTVPRALRKWLAANPEGVPADHVIYLREPRVTLSAGQSTMAKGCDTVWREVSAELSRRGCSVEVPDIEEAS